MSPGRPHTLTVLLVTLAITGTGVLVAPHVGEAGPTPLLNRYLSAVGYAINAGTQISYRGYAKPHQEKVEVERLGCNLQLKRTVVGVTHPKRSTKAFIQHWRVPLHQIQTDQIARIDYRHDAGPYANRPNLEYYGYAVVLKTGGWDIEVLNRLGHTITREREFELRFSTERAAREFTTLIASTSRECSIHSLGVGDDWNRVPGR